MAEMKIKIKGDSSSLDRTMNKSRSKIKSFGAGVAKAFGAVGVAFGGIALAFNRLKNFIDPIAGRMDDIAKASKRIGLGVDDIFEVISLSNREIKSDNNLSAEVKAQYLRGVYHQDDHFIRFIHFQEWIAGQEFRTKLSNAH